MTRPPDGSPTLFGDTLPGLPVPADFDTFWKRYPRKEGKAAARRHWGKLRPTDRIAATEALGRWLEFWQRAKTEPRFIPHGSTWVHQRRWEDTVPPVPTPTFTRGRGMAGIDEAVRFLANGAARPDMRRLGR